ncbi:MAG: nucleotide exchange factor GrpE [Desulfovibrio sp.]|jgi:molecular chaperone GrpE|nr:nucleotide exchange factor GrpE [Desulfovibrio sp.]
MHRRKVSPSGAEQREELERQDYADVFNPWDDPLGMEPPNMSGPEPAPEPRTSEDGTDGAPVTAEKTTEEEIARFRTEVEDVRLRAAAEMENFKKRLQREHDERTRYAAERVLGDLLPALDSLDLALQYGGKNEVCADLLQGVSMTRKLLLEAVAGHGLAPFGQEGETFTPDLHEAVGVEKRDDLEAGTVSRVLQSGYRLGDRVLRPAKVMIHQ